MNNDWYRRLDSLKPPNFNKNQVWTSFDCWSKIFRFDPSDHIHSDQIWNFIYQLRKWPMRPPNPTGTVIVLKIVINIFLKIKFDGYQKTKIALNWMNLLENDNGSNLIFIHHFEYHIAKTIAFLKNIVRSTEFYFLSNPMNGYFTKFYSLLIPMGLYYSLNLFFLD